MARLPSILLLLFAAFVSSAPSLPSLSRAVARSIAAGFSRSSGAPQTCTSELKIRDANPVAGESNVLTIVRSDIVEDGERCSAGKPMYLVPAPLATSQRLASLRFPIAARTLANNTDARAILRSAAGQKYGPLVGFEEGPRQCGRVSYPAGTFFFLFPPGEEGMWIASSSARVQVPAGKATLIIARPAGAGLCVYADETTARAKNVTALVLSLSPSPSPRPQEAQTPAVSGTAAVAATPDPTMLPDTPARNVGSACFPSSATVELEGGKRVSMADLRIGDRVRTGPGSFSDVFLFTHRAADVHSQFVRLVTAAGSQVILTRSHYLYADGALVSAGCVRSGDSLRLADGQLSRVTAVEDVSAGGLYNPQTVDGNVVVDGVVTSAYTTAVHPRVAHGALLAPLRFVYERAGMSVAALDALASFISQAASGLSRVVPSGPAAFVA